MKERPPANPYREADLDTLYEACQRRAGELMGHTGVARTPEERAALALDTAHLLLSVAGTLRDNDVYNASSSWKAASKYDLLKTFLPMHEHAIRGARYRTLVAAMDAALGGKQPDWMRDTKIDGTCAYDLALSSEDGLLRVLEHLQGMQADRRSEHQGADSTHGAVKPAGRSGSGK